LGIFHIFKGFPSHSCIMILSRTLMARRLVQYKCKLNLTEDVYILLSKLNLMSFARRVKNWTRT